MQPKSLLPKLNDTSRMLKDYTEAFTLVAVQVVCMTPDNCKLKQWILSDRGLACLRDNFASLSFENITSGTPREADIRCIYCIACATDDSLRQLFGDRAAEIADYAVNGYIRNEVKQYTTLTRERENAYLVEVIDTIMDAQEDYIGKRIKIAFRKNCSHRQQRRKCVRNRIYSVAP